MTILGIWILLPLLQTYAALDVFAPSAQRALVTNDAVLNCTFSVDKQPLDSNFLAVLWSFQGNVLLRYDNKGLSSQDPRMSLNVESLMEGHASLHISNVAISDGGIYKCRVIYSPESKEKEVLFDVLARPLLSIHGTKVQRNTENTLTCKASGFFPPDVLITWYREGMVLRNQVMGEPQIYKDGTYQANSTVTITPTDHDQNQNLSCKVQHDSLQEPLQMDFQLVYEDKEASSNVATVVCIILVLIAIVGIGIFFWKLKLRKKDTGTFTLMDIEGPTKLIAGEETSLHCRAANCPEKINVTWLEKRGGKECEIPAFHEGDKEEEERLLDAQYGIMQFREGQLYTSSLKFRPSVAKHKDVIFICRYSYGKEKKEKTFHCSIIYAKPQLLQPVSRSLFVSGELKYLVTLEKFYPRDITLRWTHGVGERQETIQSTETVTDIPDGTYSVCSEVRIPEKLLKDPEFKVRVSWEHQSLDTPGYKDLSIRDSEYAWNPVVEAMQTPPLFHDTPVTLQCYISEYFPDAITVTWLRRSENQELCEETEYKVSSTTTSRKEADNTYSCRATLTIDPKLSVHQGAEYICRVDHPSLETPIEMKTGKLVVKAKPQMEEPILITIGDSSRLRFTLNLQKFYPKDIEIQWKYKFGDKESEMSPSNTLGKDKDLTCDVTSVVSILVTAFINNPQNKVYVTWKHESLDEPETRTLTVRDLPWRPQVGEIVIPKLKEGERASLTCNISGYFPDNLTVSWLKKLPRTDSDPVITPLSKDLYKVSDKKTELKDKTFSCQSSLTFTPSFSRHQGAELICRVEHPSLEHPIEKTTGPITIDLPRPQVGEIVIPKLKEGERASLTCNISGCLLDHLNVSWFKKEPGTDSNPVITQLPNNDFRICNIKKTDKTFSCQSSLTITPSFSRDQGAEFICRVDQPSLEQPIEKTTGPIDLDKLFMNGTSQVQQSTSVILSKLVPNPFKGLIK